MMDVAVIGSSGRMDEVLSMVHAAVGIGHLVNPAGVNLGDFPARNRITVMPEGPVDLCVAFGGVCSDEYLVAGAAVIDVEG